MKYVYTLWSGIKKQYMRLACSSLPPVGCIRRWRVCPWNGGRDAVFTWVIVIMPNPLWRSLWNDGLAGSSSLAKCKRKMKLI